MDTPPRSRTPLIAAAVALAVVVAVAAGLWAVLGVGSANVPSLTDTTDGRGPTWAQVQRRSFPLIVTASGELEAKQKVEIKNLIQKTKPTIIDIVEEGAQVTQGDLLVTLDGEEIRQALEQETLDVENSQAQEVAAREELAIAESESESDLAAKGVELDLARLTLSKWEKGDLPQKRQELATALETARRKLDRAERDLKESEGLYEQKFISLSELEDAQIALIEAKDALAKAKMDGEVYEQYTRPSEERTNRSAVDQAEDELERAERKNASKVAQNQADLLSKQRTLAIHEAKLAELEKEMEATKLLAPQDGLVVYASSVGNSRWRNDPIAPGRQVRFNETIILLPDTRQMVASLNVHEALVPQVEQGHEVNVTVDARPGERIEGTVSTIAVMAEDGGWLNPQLREYKVKVDLPEGLDMSLKPGMRCTGEVRTGQVDDALAVPVQAVFSEGRERFCYVPVGGGSEQVRKQGVKIGRASDTLVEIKSGLEEGTLVLLRRPRAGEVEMGDGEATERQSDEVTEQSSDAVTQ